MKLIQGTPHLLNQQIDFVTEAGDDGREIDALARIVYVTFAGLTLKLPANPKDGATVRIAAIGGTVSLDGNGNVVSDTGAIVPKGTAVDLSFFGGVWTPIGGGQAFDVKPNCRVVAATNQTLSGLPTIDGIALNPGDRVLDKGQANPVQNGIWIAHAGAWTRAGDMPAGSGAESAFTFISEGATYADTGWLCTTDAPNDIVGTDPLAWAQFSTFPLATNPPANVSRSAALVGVSNAAAREDHKHDVTFAAPTGALAIGGGNSAGTGPALALSDHSHALTAPSAPVDVTKSAAATGVSGNAARADHKHDITTAAPTGALAIGGANAEGVATTLARSDHSHALTAPAAPVDVTKSAAAAGSSGNAARADHKHDVSTGTPVAVGLANAEGTATSLARSDHVHAALGLVSNHYANSTATVTTNTTFASLVATTSFTPTVGNIVRITAFVQFSVDTPSLATFQITDSVSGFVVGGIQSYPTVSVINYDTIALTWEAQILVPGSRVFTLEMKVSAGLITSTAACLTVDEFKP